MSWEMYKHAGRQVSIFSNLQSKTKMLKTET